MDALQFAYWLNGFAELSGDEPPTPAQWRSITEHLALVFTKVTPALAVGAYDKSGLGHQLMSRTSDAAIRIPPVRAECLSTAQGV